MWLISLYKYTINEREKPSITVIYFLCSHWNFLYPLHFAAGYLDRDELCRIFNQILYPIPMKKILLLFLSCFSCTIAEAQTTPPLFQGSDDVQLFRQALMERVTEVYYSDGYTPDDLIHYFWMNFTIDTLGRCIDLEIPDTCRRQTIIVKERTLELLRTALAGIDSFQPATERGEKVPYRQTMEYNFAYIPEVTTPACFKKSEPNDLTVFEKYIAKRVEYPEELRPWGVSGRVIIVFIVNTDGSVEIDKVLESPHPKMSYRVKKIILSTSGKWIPALYFGAPVRQKFVLPVDFRLR